MRRFEKVSTVVNKGGLWLGRLKLGLVALLLLWPYQTSQQEKPTNMPAKPPTSLKSKQEA